MTREMLAFLRPEKGGVFVDCTVGMGGHARALLEAGAEKVIGLDRDPPTLAIAATTLSSYGDRVELVHSDYRAIASVLDARGIDRVDGALTDMGMSSYQLDAEGRGFSFQREDPLDMRMDTTTGATAAELLRDAQETEIADAIYKFGEERFSRRIARAIVQARQSSPLADDVTARSDCQKRGAEARLFPDRSGDADVSGTSHLGESGAREHRRVLEGRGAAPADERAARRDHVSLARRSHRQTHVARARAS